MRVLHLTTEFPPVTYGGLGTAVGGLVRASIQAGLEVGVLLVGETETTAYGDRISAASPADVSSLAPLVTVFRTAWWNAAEFALRVVSGWRPDVLHLHVFWLWEVARHLRDRTGIPLVYTVHSLDVAEYWLGNGPPECLGQWELQRRVLDGADLIVTPSESERALVATYCPAAQERVRVAGHGIEFPSSDLRARSALSERGDVTVLCVGRFVDRKGVRELLAAIPSVLDSEPSTTFVLAGGHRGASGTDMAAWWLPDVLWDRHDRVRFTGWLDPPEIAVWYETADILVMPSWYEPFGMVILEGMLRGMAIAATDVGGPAEILGHGRTALLFPPRDPEALANTILRLINDGRLRQELGRAAAAEVRSRWLWPDRVYAHQRIYEEAQRGGSS